MHQFIIHGDDGSKFEFAMSPCLHTDQTIISHGSAVKCKVNKACEDDFSGR